MVSQYTNGECITSDGLLLQTVKIVPGTTIGLYIRLDYLDAPHGYGMAPATFTVEADTPCDNSMLAKLCCGLREPEGNFWYPATRQMPNVVQPDDYDWAYSYTRVFGPPTISSWIDRQARKRGEQ